MKTCRNLLAVAALSAISLSSLEAQTLAKWTFETSIPTTAGPLNPEIGAGSALGFHAGVATYSNPAGNGSAESFSANSWAVGDYFQFSLSTAGYAGIGLSFDQTSSNTGPRDYDLQYSTDGINFTAFVSYQVLANGASPNASWNGTTYQSAYTFNYDLSAITAIDNAANVYFRLANTSTVAANGGVVAAAGANRVDNFTVSVVPEPASATLLGLGFAALLIRRRN